MSGDSAATSRTNFDAILGTLVAGISLVVGLVSFKVFAEQLGPVDYGLIGVTYGVAGLAIALSWAPLYLTIVTFGPRSRQEAPALRGLALVVTLAAAGVASGLAVVSIREGSLLFAFSIIVVEVVVGGVANVELGFVNSLVGYRQVSLLRLTHVITRLAVLAVVIIVDSISLRSYAVMQGLGNVCLLLAVLAYCRWRKLPSLRYARPRRPHAATAGRFAATLGVLSVQNDYDKALLSQLGYTREVGIYTAAYRILNILATPIDQLVAASYSRQVNLARSDGQALFRFTRKLVLVALGYALVVFVVFAVAGRWLLKPLGSEYTGTYTMVLALMGVLALKAVGGFASDMLIAAGMQPRVLRVLVVSGICTMVAYYATVPSFGWKGAVFGTIVGELFTAVLILLTARRRLRFASGPVADTAHGEHTIGRVVVAMVTAADRGEALVPTLRSLAAQTRRPDKVVVIVPIVPDTNGPLEMVRAAVADIDVPVDVIAVDVEHTLGSVVPGAEHLRDDDLVVLLRDDRRYRGFVVAELEEAIHSGRDAASFSTYRYRGVRVGRVGDGMALIGRVARRLAPLRDVAFVTDAPHAADDYAIGFLLATHGVHIADLSDLLADHEVATSAEPAPGTHCEEPDTALRTRVEDHAAEALTAHFEVPIGMRLARAVSRSGRTARRASTRDRRPVRSD